tara:strand:- start:129 stop:317 length:189 start_codon:yes stop_codon:yes gene_type:complete
MKHKYKVGETINFKDLSGNTISGAIIKEQKQSFFNGEVSYDVVKEGSSYLVSENQILTLLNE